MASRIQGITVEVGGDTTKLSKALQGVNKDIKSTQTQLKDVEKLLKLDPSNAELVRQNKPAEINLAVTLKQKPELQTWYMELFRNWKRQGVKFTMGYDLHAAHFDKEKIEMLERLLTEYDFSESDFVLPFRHD